MKKRWVSIKYAEEKWENTGQYAQYSAQEREGERNAAQGGYHGGNEGTPKPLKGCVI